MSRLINKLLLAGLLEEMARSKTRHRDDDDKKEAGSITYTDDKVPVKTLYVSGIKSFISQDDLEQYFRGQGNLTKLVLHDKGDYKYAFVTFSTYEDATKVVKKRTHHLKRSKLRVRPADTWHQPKESIPQSEGNSPEDVQEAGASSTEPETWSYDENAPSLMMLNDDCLLYLLEFFNVLELVKMRGICSRLDSLIEIFCQKYVNFSFETLSLELPTELTLMNARDILTFLGPIMKSLKIDGGDFSENSNPNRTIDWIVRYCKNLESLELENFTLNRINLKKLTPVIQKLKSLSLGDSTKVNDELGSCLNRAEQMEELIISGNWEITGKCLTKAKNLKTLSVNCCGNLQSKPFKEALKNNLTLKKLEIRRCDKFDDTVVNCIVEEIKEIEELSLSNVYQCMSNYSRFAELPHLKKLSVEFHSFASIDNLLEKLSEKSILEELNYIGSSSNAVDKTIELISKITTMKNFSMAFNSNISDNDLKRLQNLAQLESLSIPGASNVTSDGLLKLLSACKNLHYLDISQVKVDIDFLEKVVQMWRLSQNRPKLQLIVYETNIQEDSEEVEKIQKENLNNLRLSFVPKMLNTHQFMFTGSDMDFSEDDEDFDFDDDEDDDYDEEDFAPPWEVYGDQWWDSDDSDKYMYGWGQYSGDRSPVAWFEN
uniref:CSON001662 protein n=1 Tax=Culicoides sonorensis TaxID=179676 RepID=A0A336MH93_CULSO